MKPGTKNCRKTSGGGRGGLGKPVMGERRPSKAIDGWKRPEETSNSAKGGLARPLMGEEA